MRTLAELATERQEIEAKISGAIGYQTKDDAERAEISDVLAALYNRLADIFADAEKVAAHDMDMWEAGAVSAFRWAITGAEAREMHYRDVAAQWRELAAAAAAVRQHDVIAEIAAEVTRRTGIEEPEIDYATQCGARCEHAGICDLAPDHEGQHSASGKCKWSS